MVKRDTELNHTYEITMNNNPRDGFEQIEFQVINPDDGDVVIDETIEPSSWIGGSTLGYSFNLPISSGKDIEEPQVRFRVLANGSTSPYDSYPVQINYDKFNLEDTEDTSGTEVAIDISSLNSTHLGLYLVTLCLLVPISREMRKTIKLQ